jgi:carboxylate-amine ligase
MSLDVHTWSLAQSSDEVIARLSGALSARASPETRASVIELKTGVHADVDGVMGEPASLRTRLADELGAMGLRVAGAGTHPLTVRHETEVSGAVRYRVLDASLRVLARREPTMALHVHVGVPAPEDPIRLLNGLRRNLSVLLALSANSPFWQRHDSGFASARTVIFQAFPRTDPPRVFFDYAHYVESVDALIAPGATPDPSLLWWDALLQPAPGTVEVRVMDAHTRVRDAAPLVALIQSLAVLELEGEPSSSMPSPEVLGENRFLSARDGMDARLIDSEASCLAPAREILDSLPVDCREPAVSLGCANAFDRCRARRPQTGPSDSTRSWPPADISTGSFRRSLTVRRTTLAHRDRGEKPQHV